MTSSADTNPADTHPADTHPANTHPANTHPANTHPANTNPALPLTQVHAYIISELKKEMPAVFGKDNKKKELIKRLGSIYEKIQREHQISPGDFPEIKRMQVCVIIIDLT